MTHAMSRRHVVAAARELHGKIVRTPTLRCPALDRIAGAELWLKAENLQRIGAFKARGALLAVGHLPSAQRARGVITYSSGNHAQAVAWAARAHGLTATIAMPEDAPAIKVAAVRELGAEVVFAGTTSADRKAVAQQLHERTGRPIVEPFDHPDIIAGQGTATLELLQDVATATDGAPLDALVVPVGGGGLIAGACLACETNHVTIHSAEPVGCDALAQSLERDKRVEVQPAQTLADGLKPTRIGALNFAIAKARVRHCHRLDDQALGSALVRLLVRGKILVEPSGAAALAAALRGDLPGRPRRVGILLSGGNIAPERLQQLLQQHGEQA